MVQERSELCPTPLLATKREQTWRWLRYTKGTLSGSSVGVGQVITLMMFPLRPFLVFFCFEIEVDIKVVLFKIPLIKSRCCTCILILLTTRLIYSVSYLIPGIC